MDRVITLIDGKVYEVTREAGGDAGAPAQAAGEG